MDCCVPKAGEGSRVPCPGCGQAGRPVAPVTVEAILHSSPAATLLSAEPRFCRTQACEILYYGSDGQSAHKREARVRVGFKESQDPLPVCYCFGFSRADIEREVAETGDCTIAARVTAEVKAGRCPARSGPPRALAAWATSTARSRKPGSVTCPKRRPDMTALLHDPYCVLGLAGVGVYLLGWAAVTSGRKLRRWWAGRENRCSVSQLPD